MRQRERPAQRRSSPNRGSDRPVRSVFRSVLNQDRVGVGRSSGRSPVLLLILSVLQLVRGTFMQRDLLRKTCGLLINKVFKKSSKHCCLCLSPLVMDFRPILLIIMKENESVHTHTQSAAIASFRRLGFKMIPAV